MPTSTVASWRCLKLYVDHCVAATQPPPSPLRLHVAWLWLVSSALQPSASTPPARGTLHPQRPPATTRQSGFGVHADVWPTASCCMHHVHVQTTGHAWPAQRSTSLHACANYGSCMARPTIDIAACSPTRPHGAKCMRPSPGRLNSASVCPECMHPPRPTHAWPVSQPLEIEREISRERARSLQPAATRDSCGGRRARPTQS